MTTPGIDQGILVSAYLGLMLLTGSLLAIGVMVSALFENPVAAFFVTLAALLALWIVSGFASGTGTLNEVARYLSLVDHYYNNLYRGVVDVADIVYYLSLTALTLFLGGQIVQARRWR
jgi:ABC-2 type transport system permease protein